MNRSGRQFPDAPTRVLPLASPILYLILLLFPLLTLSQGNVQVAPLPFQQQAPTEVNDEQLAIQLFQQRDYEKAVVVYERLYEKKPSYYTYTYYFQCLVELRDYDGAEKLVKKARKLEPDALKFQVDLGYLQYRQGNGEKAKKMYDDALKKLTPNQQQIFELANAFTMRGENEYTLKTYLRGRELIGNTYPFSFELASIYERTGNYQSMIDEYLNLLDFNRTYMNIVQDRLQSSLADDRDNLKNETFRTTLLLRAQREPEKTYYSELLWWYSLQQKDFELALIQAKSIDKRNREDGNRIYQLASMCVSNEQYDVAMDAYAYLVSKGSDYPLYMSSKMELLNTKMLKITSSYKPELKSLVEMEKEFTDEIDQYGVNGRTVTLVKSLAHLDAFYLNKIDQAITLLEKTVDLVDINAQARADCKIELADILLFSGSPWEATLLYQQVYKDFKNDVVGQTAKFKNAKLSYYIGEFAWAQTQLDVLKAATSKLIANDAMSLALLISENFDTDSGTVALTYFAHADLLEFRNENDQALLTLDSINLAFTYHTLFDDVLYKKAEIKMKQGKFEEADTLLGMLIKDYASDVLADLALMTRGKLNEEVLGNKDKAMQQYEWLMTNYPGSIYAVEARKRFRTLRGDKIQ